ncbi:MAG: GNAT family N-acetyltransferase [Anaerolineae bacterium]
MPVSYRPCTTNAEYEQIKALEVAIWQMPAHEAITTHTLHVLTHNGGLALGAFDEGRMIGMAVAFATRHPQRLWSHMAGVRPDYQGAGIGYQLKQAQRDWALANDYTEMRWTFDPALRRNANFNFHQLGAITHIYHANFYGVMQDAINAGVPSDRFEAHWQLDTNPVTHTPPTDLTFLLCADDNQRPQITSHPHARYHGVQCPYDFHAIKADDLDCALAWRATMREVLQGAFAQGYHVVDFVTDPAQRRCYYVLHRYPVGDF